MRVLLADAILLNHFLFVLFVVGGLLLTWVGAWRSWHWIHSLKFRIVPLIAIVIVAAESLLGIVCTLAGWDDDLRGTTGEKRFIARWVNQLMFISAPAWVFTLLYMEFAVIAVMMLVLIPRHAQKNPAVKQR